MKSGKRKGCGTIIVIFFAIAIISLIIRGLIAHPWIFVVFMLALIGSLVLLSKLRVKQKETECGSFSKDDYEVTRKKYIIYISALVLLFFLVTIIGVSCDNNKNSAPNDSLSVSEISTVEDIDAVTTSSTANTTTTTTKSTTSTTTTTTTTTSTTKAATTTTQPPTEPPTPAPTEPPTPEPTEPPTEPPTETPTEAKIEVPATEAPAVEQNNNQSITVYYTKTGEKYHYENPCGRGTYYPCTLEEALAKGLEPCEKCVLH